MTRSTTTQPRRAATRPQRAWLKIFWIGLGLWAATVVVTVVTANSNLVPTIVLLGSFLVPVTFAAWAYEHGRDAEVTVPLLFTAFVVGGVLGVLGASLLETYLLRPSPWMYAGIGLIEEGIKLAALMLVARHLRRRSLRDGLVLGATVGFGFAAFESAGYALNALFSIDGLSLRAMVETEILRGLLTPLGHGLWTAILGGMLFSTSRNGRWRLGAPLLATYLGVSALHALWDSMHGIAIALTLRFTGADWQWSLLRHGYLPQATTGQNHLIAVLNWAGIVMISLVALVWLRSLVQRSLLRSRDRRGL